MTIRCGALLSVLTFSTLFAGPLLASAGAAPQVVISDIQVKLFYDNSGRFSANLAQKKDLALWNVVIGEGVGVDGPSNNTLLLVTVTGTPKGYFEKLRLHVLAKTEKATLVEREDGVGIFNSAGNWYAPFLLYGTGCEPVTVTAQLVAGETRSAPVTFTIPFECGE